MSAWVTLRPCGGVNEDELAAGDGLAGAPAARLERHDGVGVAVDDQRRHREGRQVRPKVGACEGADALERGLGRGERRDVAVVDPLRLAHQVGRVATAKKLVTYPSTKATRSAFAPASGQSGCVHGSTTMVDDGPARWRRAVRASWSRSDRLRRGHSRRVWRAQVAPKSGRCERLDTARYGRRTGAAAARGRPPAGRARSTWCCGRAWREVRRWLDDGSRVWGQLCVAVIVAVAGAP